MKRILRSWALVLSLVSGPWAWAQFTPIEPDSAKPSTPGYQQRLQARLDSLLWIQTYNAQGGSAGVDDGKNTWPRLMAELHKAERTNNTSRFNTLITTTGRSLLRSQWAGSFCGTFSIPGYTHYILTYRSVLPQEQLDSAYNNMYQVSRFPYRCQAGTGWDLISRGDRFMDAVNSDPASPSYNPNGAEFNSENYHWMQRMGGYLWAQHYNDAPRQSYYDTWLKNWGRALLHVGRVEWNSNNYWGHTLNPALVLYRHTTQPDDRRIAKAALDWNLTELALHYLDGAFIAGADSRAKTGAYRNLSGSAGCYASLFFNDDSHPTSLSRFWARSFTREDIVGYYPGSGYLPPQQFLDLAWREYQTPVEIHSAKPFYHIDHDSYADWQGNTTRSRRNEFEFLYLERDYILNSLATNRPDGKIGTFSEQSLWRFAVRGSTAGPIQIMGGVGTFAYPAGRAVNEQIGQFRNVMLRAVKNEDTLWIGLPRTLTEDWEGDTLFLDMGNDVYAAFVPYQSQGHTETPMAGDAAYHRLRWTYTPSDLGALALEVGTAAEYGSYAAFRAAVLAQSRFTLDSIDKITYTSSRNHQLTMGYRPTVVYPLAAALGTQTEVNPAGTVPRLWFNGVANNFSTWNSYEVVQGEDIIRQDWGAGELHLRLKGKGLRIKSLASTGLVQYDTFPAPPQFVVTSTARPQVSASTWKVWPNPSASAQTLTLLSEQKVKQVLLLDVSGRVVSNLGTLRSLGKEDYQFTLPVLSAGVYHMQVVFENGQRSSQRLVIQP